MKSIKEISVSVTPNNDRKKAETKSILDVLQLIKSGNPEIIARSKKIDKRFNELKLLCKIDSSGNSYYENETKAAGLLNQFIKEQNSLPVIYGGKFKSNIALTEKFQETDLMLLRVVAQEDLEDLFDYFRKREEVLSCFLTAEKSYINIIIALDRTVYDSKHIHRLYQYYFYQKMLFSLVMFITEPLYGFLLNYDQNIYINENAKRLEVLSLEEMGEQPNQNQKISLSAQGELFDVKN